MDPTSPGLTKPKAEWAFGIVLDEIRDSWGRNQRGMEWS